MFPTLDVAFGLLPAVALAAVAAVVGILIGRRFPRKPTDASDPQVRLTRGRLQEELPAASDTGAADDLANYHARVVPLIRPERWRIAENFTPAGRRVLANAHLQAYTHHSDHVGTEHVLIAIIDDCPDQLREFLRGNSTTPDDLRQCIESVIGPAKTPRAAHLPYSPSVKGALDVSAREALATTDQLIDVEHILRGLLSQRDSAAAKFVSGVSPEPVSAREASWYELPGHRNAS